MAILLVIALWIHLLVSLQGLGLGTELQHHHNSGEIDKLTIGVPYCGGVHIAGTSNGQELAGSGQDRTGRLARHNT